MSAHIQYLKETPEEKLPKGKEMKESMYKHFCKDMKRLRKTETRKKKDKGTVISTFNVHFFQRGYSGICISNNFKDFEEFLSKEQPEFVLLQEVPSWDISKYLKNIGYSIAVSASCPECHELPEDLQLYDLNNELSRCKDVLKDRRLRTMIAYRVTQNPWCLVSSESVNIDKRQGQVSLATFSNKDRRRIGLISLHLSVRCDPSRRLSEIKHILKYCNLHLKTTCDALIIAGDFNQAVKTDYEPEHWKILSQDMKRSGVPLSDGVAELMSEHNFVCSFEACNLACPVVTCWGASRVDWIYFRDQSGGDLSIKNASLIGSDISDHAPMLSTFSFV